jgi:hypothetical protein
VHEQDARQRLPVQVKPELSEELVVRDRRGLEELDEVAPEISFTLGDSPGNSKFRSLLAHATTVLGDRVRMAADAVARPAYEPR